jgi:spore germination protein
MLNSKKRGRSKQPPSNNDASNIEEPRQLTVSENIEDNITAVKSYLGGSSDVRARRFRIGGIGLAAAAVFIENLVKEDVLLEYLIRPLMLRQLLTSEEQKININTQTIRDCLVSSEQIEEYKSFDKIIFAVLSGDTFLTIEGLDTGIVVSTKNKTGRSIEEPKVEPSIKGPKEAFVENLKENMGMIRKRLKDPNLTFESWKVGRRSKTDVVIVFIKGIANENFVKEARKRIGSIDTDDAVSAGRLVNYISDRPYSVFPLLQVSERPDTVVAGILEGRVAVIMDGSPNIIILPATLPILMQSVDDYYEKWAIGSLIRLGRYTALFISALFPSLYIAITSFHPGILPTNILLSIAGTRGGLPFPAFVEAIMMNIVLEILIEAGIRLPKAVGQTVSIVGGLVIGQAAVQAGIIGPIMVIVVAVTAISSFAIPDYSLGLAVRALRMVFMLFAGILGAVGTSLGLLVMLGYTASLESFGVGYLEPMTPYRLRDLKDTFIRAPQNVFGKRPEFLSPEDTQRQKVRKGGDSSGNK